MFLLLVKRPVSSQIYVESSEKEKSENLHPNEHGDTLVFS